MSEWYPWFYYLAPALIVLGLSQLVVPEKKLSGYSMIIAGIGLAVVGAILSSYSSKPVVKEEKKYAREEAPNYQALEKYLPLYNSDFSIGKDSPHVRGQIVFIDGLNKSIYKSLMDYHAAVYLRANKPEDVGTVASLKCDRVLAGHYKIVKGDIIDKLLTGEQDAFQWKCNLQIIDLASKEIVDDKSIAGAMPPAEIASINTISYDTGFPYDDIINYMYSLPRRY